MLDFIFGKPFTIRITDSIVQVMFIDGDEKKIKSINYGEEIIPEGVVTDNEIIQEKVLAQSIKNAIAKVKPNPLSSKKCVLVWPENLTYTQLFPSIKPAVGDELKKEMDDLVSGSIPVPLSQLTYQYLNFNFGKTKMSFVAAAEKEKLEKYKNFLSSACGLKVIDIEPAFISLTRNIPSSNIQKINATFIHTEFNSINIFTTFSGIIFDSIRVKYSLNPKQTLEHELSKSIALFEQQFQQKISNIFLVGENEFESLLNEKFQIPRKQIIKFNLDLTKTGISGNDYLIISGAALRQLSFKTITPINFMN